jgi:D-3-phosphoglycerate dehydrogenase
MLLRHTFTVSTELHRGIWNKSAAGCHEVRGLVLGILGYSRIGSQLSDLAEALGMRVIFSDVTDVLARGTPSGVRSRRFFRRLTSSACTSMESREIEICSARKNSGS